jgi:uncharacterized RDD family membrane protein YckC
MMGEAAGWYRDPAPPNPATPSTLRFWDGQQWTAQVRPAPKRQRLAWQAEDADQRRALAMEQAELVARQMAGQGTSGQQTGVQVAPPRLVVEVSRDFTPDGEQLAGWGRRYAAVVLDNTILTALVIAFGWHYLTRIVGAYTDALNQMVQASNAGQQPPDTDALVDTMMSAIWPALVGFLVVSIVVRCLYYVGFLKGFQATPGKLMLGLQVRLRDRPGPLPWGTVLLRWATQVGYGFFGVIPFVGALTSIYWLLDNLWPLWDGKRQALHDKAARTNVVKLR